MSMYNHTQELKLRNLILEEHKRKGTQSSEEDKSSFDYCRGILVSLFILDLVSCSEFERIFRDEYDFWMKGGEENV